MNWEKVGHTAVLEYLEELEQLSQEGQAVQQF